MSDTALAFMPTAKLRTRIASKQLSPVEVTRLYLQRIEALDPVLRASVAFEQARPWADKRPPV